MEILGDAKQMVDPMVTATLDSAQNASAADGELPFVLPTVRSDPRAQYATRREWFDLVERASPRERSLFWFRAPGDPHCDEQTLADTQMRYPGADLAPYR